ncbi:muramidase family protein [Jeotgalibaca caeni]|uniref:muramidase family protein n=1 Tax=Jeotgalibaca caeni TaxID=3028623 RepID=UPI00237DAB59|nr:LysM peptidoglycan-binding domain-containing protein [Jeotgalibaca caeni]MDE1549259.1 LysM peptidoglycan-binding domain-containing protein [Jeotgalibaca caeni]
MELSRKQWHAMKNKKELKDKVMQTAAKMKKSVAFISTSVLVAPIVLPMQEANAEEKKTSNQVETKVHGNAFLNSIVTPAKSIAQKNDLYASVMLAQAILESGWGQSGLASEPNYNLFGIKGDYNGQSVEKKTLEDNGKQEYYEITAKFRKYPSYAESLEDYAALLRNGTSWDPEYYSGAWKSNASTYEDATTYLTGRYATDTAYATKLNKIIEANGLTSYDTPSTVAPTTPVVKPSTPVASGSYTVQSGDTLYGIATRHGISVVQLMEWNQLNSSMIHPGMKLLVAKKVTPAPVKPVETVKPVEKPKPATQNSYQVKTGDTLWAISQKYQVTPAQLKEWNQLKNELIHPGQILKLAATKVEPKPVVTEPVKESNPTQATRNSINVSTGDTLYSLATRAGLSVAELKAINQLESDLIHPGQTLYTQKTAPVVKEEAPKPVVTPVVTGEYIVQKGDTLYKIAQQAGVSVTQIKEWNQLNSDLIFVGQSLQMKQNAAVQTPAPAKPTNTYQVQKGDTLYSIAKRHNISLADLLAWNQMNSSMIHPGQNLRVK